MCQSRLGAALEGGGLWVCGVCGVCGGGGAGRERSSAAAVYLDGLGHCQTIGIEVLALVDLLPRRLNGVLEHVVVHVVSELHLRAVQERETGGRVRRKGLNC